MKKPPEAKEIELHPDAMERFERAVKTVAKAPPQHRIKKRKVASIRKPRVKEEK